MTHALELGVLGTTIAEASVQLKHVGLIEGLRRVPSLTRGLACVPAQIDA